MDPAEPGATADLETHIEAHHPEAIRQRLGLQYRHSYVKDFIYGAIDGAVTTFAVVAAVTGAELSPGIVILIGAANLLGDGFSMAAGNYLGTRAEHQMRERVRSTEAAHIARYAEGEREEVRQIFAAKGFEGEDLDRIVEIITSDQEQWIDTMVTEEHGLPLSGASPVRAALTTFAAFFSLGALPLLPFIAQYLWPGTLPSPFVASTALTAVAFFAVGLAKGRLVEKSGFWSGIETLFVGGAAAGLAYLVGVLGKSIVA